MKSKRTKEFLLEGKMETRNSSINLPSVAKSYNGEERHTFLFGGTPQAELWNGRFSND